MLRTSLPCRSTVAFTYLKVKFIKCLCLLPVVLVLVLLSWSWSCKQRSWSWFCYFGLGLKNLVLFTSVYRITLCVSGTRMDSGRSAELRKWSHCAAIVGRSCNQCSWVCGGLDHMAWQIFSITTLLQRPSSMKTHVRRYKNAIIIDFNGTKITEVVMTTGAISHAKLQSNHHHQQTNTQLFHRPDALPVVQPTVSKHWRKKASYCMDLLTPSSPGGFPSMSWPLQVPGWLWLHWGEPLINWLTPILQYIFSTTSLNIQNSESETVVLQCILQQNRKCDQDEQTGYVPRRRSH